MNVELLEKLAQAVKPGHARFNDDLNVAFSLARYFTRGDEFIPNRPDLGDRSQYNATACLAGFTFFVADKVPLLLKKPEDDWKSMNMYYEAGNMLGLSDDTCFALMHDCMDEMATGEEAYRAVRGLLITGNVDWYAARRK